MSLESDGCIALELHVMLDLWIAFFILGNLSARVVVFWELVWWLHLPWFGAVNLCLAIGLGRAWQVAWLRPWRQLLLACCAFIWGLAHGAPSLMRSTPDVQVEMVSVGDGSPGPLLIRSGSHLFESYGQRTHGAIGRAVVTQSDTPRLFSRGNSHFIMLSGQLLPQGAARAFSTWIKGRLQRGPRLQQLVPRGWWSGILLGDKRDLAPALKTAFKLAGVYHLLVVSGLHVTIMMFLIALLLRVPLHLAYALRLIPGSWWPEVAAVVRVAVALMSVIYLVMAGMPVAAQRATLLFVWYQLGCVFIGTMPLTTRLLLGATLQTLVFPIGFVSEATLMTWGAYLMVVHVGHAQWRQGFFFALRQTLALQLRMMVLVAGVFGQVSLLGLIANLCLVPLLGILLASGLLVVFLPIFRSGDLLLAFHASFAETVSRLASLTATYTWLAPTPEALPIWFRPLALVFSAWLLLNACRDLSIRRYDLK